MRTPVWMNDEGVPFYRDPSGRHALRGVAGGHWTHLVVDEGTAVGYDVEGCELLEDVPAPTSDLTLTRRETQLEGGRPRRSGPAAGTRQTVAGAMIALGVLGLIGGGIWWAWLNGQVDRSPLIRQADSTGPAVVLLVVSAVVLFTGVVVLVASLPGRR